MKTILLTGFEPFSDIPVNPSETLVGDLKSRFAFNKDFQFQTLIVPVDYEKAGAVIDALDFSKYSFVFEFGVASQRSKVSLERVALNWIESSIPDNAGRNYQPKKIGGESTGALFNELDLSKMNHTLNGLFPKSVEVSFSAGAYLCNFVYYKSLLKAKTVLFVHIPLSFERERLLQIGQKIIELVINTQLVK